MATSSANPDTLQLQSTLGSLPALAALLGGTKTTSSPGDTGALQQTMAGLQGQDYEKMLQAIFSKAGGAIPGLQAGLSNAIGARSGGNSAVAAALQKLMASTTTNAQDQIAKLQAQNFATQANVGSSIAQATKGTTVKEGTNLQQATQLLAIMSGLKKLGVQDLFKEEADTSPVDMSGFNTQAAPVTYAPAQDFGGNNAFTQSIFSDPIGSFQPVGDIASGVANDYSPVFDFNSPVVDMPQELGTDYTYTPIPDPEIPLELGTDYADGGLVKAGGSRRSANPTVVRPSVNGTGVQQQPQTAAPVGDFIIPMPDNSGMNLNTNQGSGKGTAGGFNEGMSAGPGISKGTAGKIGAVNALSGLTGGPSVPGLGGLLGLASAKDNKEALASAGMTVANVAAPGLGSVVGMAMNPTAANAINVATSLNPATATINAGLGLFGTSIGALAMGTPQTVDAMGNVTKEATSGLFGSPVAEVSAVSPPGQVTTTDLGMLGGDGSGGDFGGFGDRGPGGSSGDTGASDAGAGPGGPGDLANGGEVNGAGTGTSDSIKANLSDGEFVMSADVVNALGEDFFNQLQAAFHTPVKAKAKAKTMRRA